MTIILNGVGKDFNPRKARSAVSAYRALDSGKDLSGNPISEEEKRQMGRDRIRALRNMRAEAPIVKIENGVVTWNPQISE